MSVQLHMCELEDQFSQIKKINKTIDNFSVTNLSISIKNKNL